jgi:tetratricopeptide (TPR) repeat protein
MKDEFLTDHPDLEKLFEKLRLDPDSLVFAPLADGCRKAGRLEEALDICTQGVSQHPDYASGHVVLGKCYYDNQEIDMAAETFNTVLSLDENNLVALKFLGMIQAESGDETAAREHFRHILALDPENTEIRTQLEHLQVDQAGKDDRVMTADSDESTDKESVSGEEFEGKTISLGEATETSDEFATLTLADIYASQGYTDKAIKIYREVLKDRPGNTMARDKLAALELEEGSDLPTGDDSMDLPPIPPAEPTDEEMEELHDRADKPSPGPPDDKPASDLSPDEPEASPGSDSSSEESMEPRTSSKPDSPVAPGVSESADDTGKTIDEKSSRQHFQDWIRRMGD